MSVVYQIRWEKQEGCEALERTEQAEAGQMGLSFRSPCHFDLSQGRKMAAATQVVHLPYLPTAAD